MFRKAKSYKIRKTRHSGSLILAYFVSFERQNIIYKSNTFSNCRLQKSKILLKRNFHDFMCQNHQNMSFEPGPKKVD